MQHQSPRKKIFLYFFLCILFSLIILAAFYPCLKADFTNWDDNVHLTENVVVKAVAWEGLGLNTLYDIFRQRVNNTYQPLTILTYAIEFYFFKDNPFVYHLNNLILHILVSLLVFAFFLRLRLSLLWASLAALFFALHPTKVESVAWITERKDVLYALFYMLALHTYLSYQKRKRFWLYALTFIFGILSILSKAMALSLPLILMLMDWFEGRKLTLRSLLEKIPFFLAIGGIAVITYLAFVRNPIYHYGESALLWIWCFVFYLHKFFFPFLLLPIYARPQFIMLPDPEFYLSVACFILVLISLWVFRRRKYVLFGFGFYFLSIFFLFRFDPMDAHFVADRFVYLPSAGLCFLMFVFLQEMCAGFKKRRQLATNGVVFIVLIVLVFFGIKTFHQNGIWKNNVTLWEYQLQYNQDHPTPFNNLAVGFDIDGYRDQSLADFEELRKKVEEDPHYLKTLSMDYLYPTEIENIAKRRIWLLRRALHLNPHFSDALFNLGLIYTNLGKTDQAIEFLEKSLRANPKAYRTYRELANLLVEKGDDRRAITLYLGILGLPDAEKDPSTYMLLIQEFNSIIRKKEQHDPATLELYKQARQKTLDFYRYWISLKGPRQTDVHNLAWVYEDMGGYFSSIILYRQLLEEKPRDVDTMHMLGSLCYEIGELEEALDVYKKIAIITPRDENVYLNLGAIYNKMGRFQEAIDHYQKALELNPYHRKAYFNLGYVHENLNQDRKAIEYYETVIRMHPQYAEAYYNTGNIYAKLKDLKQAAKFFQQTLEIKPDHLNALINLSIVSFFTRDFEQALQAVEQAQALGYKPPEKFLEALHSAARGEELKIPRSTVREFITELFQIKEEEAF